MEEANTFIIHLESDDLPALAEESDLQFDDLPFLQAESDCEGEEDLDQSLDPENFIFVPGDLSFPPEDEFDPGDVFVPISGDVFVPIPISLPVQPLPVDVFDVAPSLPDLRSAVPPHILVQCEIDARLLLNHYQRNPGSSIGASSLYGSPMPTGMWLPNNVAHEWKICQCQAMVLPWQVRGVTGSLFFVFFSFF